MKIVSLIALMITTFSLMAADNNFNLIPIVGYERVQKVLPTPHATSRLTYGLRATYGAKLLSAELEATTAKDDESFPTQDLTIEETAYKVKLGARSTIELANILDWYLRAGVQGSRKEITQTDNGVVTKTNPADKVDPYAGTGLNIKYGTFFHLTAGMTFVFVDEPTDGDVDIQTTLGFRIKY